MTTTLAMAANLALDLESARGPAWWQTIGGLVVVFTLLFLSLRLLNRWGRSRNAGKAEILGVWALGPKREVQILRLQDMVHFIYRHDGAMVILQKMPLTEYRATASAGGPEPVLTPRRDLLSRFRSRSGSVCLSSDQGM